MPQKTQNGCSSTMAYVYFHGCVLYPGYYPTNIFCKFCRTLIPVLGTSSTSVRLSYPHPELLYVLYTSVTNTRGTRTAVLYLSRTSGCDPHAQIHSGSEYFHSRVCAEGSLRLLSDPSTLSFRYMTLEGFILTVLRRFYILFFHVYSEVPVTTLGSPSSPCVVALRYRASTRSSDTFDDVSDTATGSPQSSIWEKV